MSVRLSSVCAQSWNCDLGESVFRFAFTPSSRPKHLSFSGNDFEFRPEVDRKWTKKKTEPFCILPYNKIDILKSDEIFSNRNFFEIFNSATSFPTMYNSVSITTFEGYQSLMRFGVKCGWDWWFGHVTTWTDVCG